ncbi:MAG TPA: bifunctional precorrin-2 dehydrogenase/sirohydrochlorin ferrochelatase [Sulfurovum sp.]|jgi:precorrin-2 dehydrogenase/sirohydrochlorin ferrochelatase|nr:MAG: siroheme synthase [Sulfurovum sp. 35-42-20]OYY56907.1 MAG: siroheme synthase [Sulfurovum sp. 28-43-6]OYZ26244.1 MAG: siroheme synthase [Sulfurovum sp. 16-42-52]OYZ48862.1 MAG: siroheme synthase [Sulfurovum sp. 24-42-9]OZA46578.1 MAG: siroheme synthase [Sulfurovum sp. 17-42-90]OZA59318.1 MAG: siroheme synthase [Sulfurovum sp. 39-42-12]HQR74103.1 bifunctional precorrin-2 dehydrogenase/sirohydrochlorin ferrochelatase [Sulfurovum sp.]
MGYFPFYMKMDGLKVLVVGGGAIGAEKLEKLLCFTEEITVIAPNVSSESAQMIAAYGLVLHQRAYEKTDIAGFDIVIVATDDVALHQAIFEESRGSRTLVNSVDNTAYCDFIFPSLVQKGELSVAFSTGGISPAFSKQIRAYFEKKIPDSVGDFLQQMKALRHQIPKGKERMRYFETLVEAYFKKNFN